MGKAGKMESFSEIEGRRYLWRQAPGNFLMGQSGNIDF